MMNTKDSYHRAQLFQHRRIIIFKNLKTPPNDEYHNLVQLFAPS